MKIPEKVFWAINEMFYCKTIKEHFECYRKYYEELKECCFVIFSENEGTELPKALCTNYDNNFAVINIGFTNKYYAMNKEIYDEMRKTKKSDYYIDACIELDTQAVSYLKDIFKENNETNPIDRLGGLIEYLRMR